MSEENESSSQDKTVKNNGLNNNNNNNNGSITKKKGREEDNNNKEKGLESEPKDNSFNSSRSPQKYKQNKLDFSPTKRVENKKSEELGREKEIEKPKKRGRPAKSPQGNERKAEKKYEEEEEEGEEYEVESVLDSKIKKGKVHYFVRWKGFGPSDDTWEPEEGVKHLAVVQEYEKKKSGSSNISKKVPEKRKNETEKQTGEFAPTKEGEKESKRSKLSPKEGYTSSPKQVTAIDDNSLMTKTKTTLLSEMDITKARPELVGKNVGVKSSQLTPRVISPSVSDDE
eukprot:TRINITY_DN2195_c0_g1_i2.p1 TRINITY_DN2195_c0_g1~~TRINITY_DN2195_c0_g1_i2.p1  ORF type:complete len:284 (-),score=91.82 TRINITY_DN2195_c0_g1_i2:249-1100(-)